MLVDEDLTLEDLGTAVAPAPSRRRRGAAGAAAGWVRDRLATTPGRLVLVQILVVVGAVCFGAIATGAEQSREHAAKAARTQTEPLLVQAADLYTALSDANATEATALLQGGLEPPAKRARYQADLRTASNALSALTREAGTSASAAVALNTITNQLPEYSGLVESARANSRQGFPTGAAYLRQAVLLSTSSMLPAADRIYRTEAQRLQEDYHTGTATAALVTFIVACAFALILLLLAQAYVGGGDREGPADARAGGKEPVPALDHALGRSRRPGAAAPAPSGCARSGVVASCCAPTDCGTTHPAPASSAG